MMNNLRATSLNWGKAQVPPFAQGCVAMSEYISGCHT